MSREAEWREAFAFYSIYNVDSGHFDRPRTGSISITLLKDIVRSLGQAPTHAQLEEIERIADPSNTGSFDFGGLCTVMSHLEMYPTTQSDLESAFGALTAGDEGTPESETASQAAAEGKIHVSLLHEKMKRHLSDRDFRGLIADARPDVNGFIDFRTFSRRMLEVQDESITHKSLPSSPGVEEIKAKLFALYGNESGKAYAYPFKSDDEIIMEYNEQEKW